MSSWREETNLGSIGELVVGEIDLSKGAFSYELPQGIVADIFEVLVGKLAIQQVRLDQWHRAETVASPYSRSSWYELASCKASQYDVQRSMTSFRS